jgi:glycosyltransferase involved in cell wall biosynthesis
MNVAKTLKRLTSTSVQRGIARADRARDLRDWPAAAAGYAEALALDPDRDAIWVQYGHALKESGRVDEAEAAYRRALSIDDRVADSHLQLGHALKVGGRLRDAGLAYMDALERDPGMAEALRELQELALRGIAVPTERLEAVLDQIVTASTAGGSTAGGSTTGRSIAGGTAADAPVGAAGLAAALEQLHITGLGADDQALLLTAAARLRTLAATATTDTATSPPETVVRIVFDASDLMHHFRHSRLPTGIQRLQIAIIQQAVQFDPDGVRLCAAWGDHWVRIPSALFQLLAILSAQGSDTNATDWRDAATRLEIALSTDQSYAFPHGAWLVNLGTSWHADYLLKIRNAKRDHGIRFVPFVHDLIPIVAPQFVLPDLTGDFVDWILAIFDHADFFLTNSKSTRNDLIAAARRLGHPLTEADVEVVPLDGRFAIPPVPAEQKRDVLRARGVHGKPFVLFVATIEPRKNHLVALNAWMTLIAEFGEAMPRLVCVGGRGWMNDEIFRLAGSTEELSRHVRFLHDLSDTELSICYDACLFTLFPSHYEGWGLPITESLCHGKIPLLADNSSLPEAGGAFGVYFESGAQTALEDRLRTMIGDAAYRQEREDHIARAFMPRSWAMLATQIRDAIVRHAGIDQPARTAVHRVRLGSFYTFARAQSRRLRADLVTGNALRAGKEWYSPEDWGAWARGRSVALALCLPEGTTVRAYIGVRGMPGAPSTLTIVVDGSDVRDVTIPPSETRWLSITISPRTHPVTIEICSTRLVDLRELTNGHDTRVVGPGMLGFYACRVEDSDARLAFVEALATGMLVPGALDTGSDAAVPAPDRAALPTPEEPDDAAGPADAPVPTPAIPEPVVAPPVEDLPAALDDILILQSSDPEVYAPMLAQSARTTRAYAERHRCGYSAFVGIKRGFLPWHATYNRIDMLLDLVRSDYQGWVVYIDADAWIEDLDFDVRAYLADKSEYAVIAAPAGHLADFFWNVNIGVVLLNLAHPLARTLIVEWERFLSRYDVAVEAKTWNGEIPDDQGMFHQILDKLPGAADHVLVEDKALLNSPWAHFIRQAIRAENGDFDKRLALVTAEVDAVMQRAGG